MRSLHSVPLYRDSNAGSPLHAGTHCICLRLLAAIGRFSNFLDEIWSMYDQQDDLGQGVSTGWSGLDPFYRVRQCCSHASVAVLVYKNIG